MAADVRQRNTRLVMYSGFSHHPAGGLEGSSLCPDRSPWHAGLVPWMFLTWLVLISATDRLLTDSFIHLLHFLFHRRRKKFEGFHLRETETATKLKRKSHFRCLRNTRWRPLCSWTGLISLRRYHFSKRLAVNKPTNWLRIHSSLLWPPNVTFWQARLSVKAQLSHKLPFISNLEGNRMY